MKRTPEYLYEKMFSVYHSPYSNIWSDCNYIDVHRYSKIAIITKIKELINEGYKVKCGYSSTSIRNVHHYYIFYKPKP